MLDLRWGAPLLALVFAVSLGLTALGAGCHGGCTEIDKGPPLQVILFDARTNRVLCQGGGEFTPRDGGPTFAGAIMPGGDPCSMSVLRDEPGRYVGTVHAEGYAPRTIHVTIEGEENDCHAVQKRIFVPLEPLP